MKPFMTRFISIILIMTLLALAISGCGKANTTKTPGTLATSSQPVSEETTTQATTTAAGETTTASTTSSGLPPFVDAINRYQTFKSPVFELLSQKMSDDPTQAANLMTMAGVAIMDLYLLPITYLAALEYFDGKPGALGDLMMVKGKGKIDKNGSKYNFEAESTEDNPFKVVGEYDEKADSMKYTYYESGKEKIYFEFVRTADGYASQYYLFPDDNSSDSENLYLNYVTANALYVGLDTVKTMPASIYCGNPPSGLAFIANADKQYSLVDGKLTSK